MRFKKAFTLFEVLIAVSISALVAAGLFTMFSAVAEVRESSITKSEDIIAIESITKLLNRDARMIIDGTLAVDSSEDIRKLKFSTQNSLRFNKALPADIIYYVEDGWLLRRETNTQVLYDMEMKLVPGVSDMKIEFYDGNKYQEELAANAKIIRITFTINGSPVTVLTARTVENV